MVERFVSGSKVHVELARRKNLASTSVDNFFQEQSTTVANNLEQALPHQAVLIFGTQDYELGLNENNWIFTKMKTRCKKSYKRYIRNRYDLSKNSLEEQLSVESEPTLSCSDFCLRFIDLFTAGYQTFNDRDLAIAVSGYADRIDSTTFKQLAELIHQDYSDYNYLLKVMRRNPDNPIELWNQIKKEVSWYQSLPNFNIFTELELTQWLVLHPDHNEAFLVNKFVESHWPK